MKKCEIKTKCPDLKGECGEQHKFFWSSFQQELFFNRCQVNSRLVTILTSLVFFNFLKEFG